MASLLPSLGLKLTQLSREIQDGELYKIRDMSTSFLTLEYDYKIFLHIFRVMFHGRITEILSLSKMQYGNLNVFQVSIKNTAVKYLS